MTFESVPSALITEGARAASFFAVLISLMFTCWKANFAMVAVELLTTQEEKGYSANYKNDKTALIAVMSFII